tara:strand:- start:1568 stop:2095 length:528 start_codon:yes stop_codon:yes gene_type:complete
MDFNYFSFLIGLVVAFAIYRFLTWSENSSLAGRISHGLCDQAFLEIEKAYLKSLIIESDKGHTSFLSIAGEPHIEKNNEDSELIDVFPIDTNEFTIMRLRELDRHDLFEITSNFGVYSKSHDLWIIIEKSWCTDKLLYRFEHRYICKPNFISPDPIPTPFQFDVKKHFIRSKSAG